jgi:malonyl-CoA/methylmalonyl-CoA synthetase
MCSFFRSKPVWEAPEMSFPSRLQQLRSSVPVFPFSVFACGDVGDILDSRPMNLTDLFDLSFHSRRAAVAIEFRGQQLTFADIDVRSNRMARLLSSRGLQPGDRLCICLPNSIDMVDLLLGCMKLGITFVPINILYKEREINHILLDSKPAAAVTAAERFPSAVPVWRVEEIAAAASQLDSTRFAANMDGDVPAAIIHTSGTTGASKGAILSHNNFAANAVNLIMCWQISPADRFLLALPLFHVHGLANGLVVSLISGCRMRLLERFEHESSITQFEEFRPTLFYGVPTIYTRLLATPVEIARKIGGFMRLFVSGSAPLTCQVFEGFHRLFGHFILERYGMTETLMNISNPYAGERRAGSVGLPLPGVSIRLLDREGKPVPPGEAGEVYVRGPNVFSGYWNRADATREAFVDGYFRTGDIAVLSRDGYYTLHGRRSDLIISGGFNIYPREIEELLEENASVREAAVVGAPDALRGEVPVAYVVLRENLDISELEAACRASLASFKVPRRFIIVDKLPRTALGKIQKNQLQRKLNRTEPRP